MRVVAGIAMMLLLFVRGFVLWFLLTTTDTSVAFTVLSTGYFDYPGSSISFSTTVEGGRLYLTQEAYSTGSSLPTAVLAPIGAYSTWEQQARNFSNVLAENSR